MDVPTTLFVAVFALIAGFMVFQVIKGRGIRGAMFGAPIARTIGELELDKRRMVRMRLKVHCLETSADEKPLVGVEVTSSTFRGYSMMPIVLSREQATAFARMIADAANESEALRTR